MSYCGFAKGIGIACVILLTLANESAFANGGGSWGSSGGSWGSSHGSSGGSWGSSGGGSWGSSGGGFLNGRRPVRNLLGRIGSRLFPGSSGGYASSGGSYGSSGGSWGSSYGSSGGSHGSHYSYGSSGGSHGYANYSNVSAPYYSTNPVMGSYESGMQLPNGQMPYYEGTPINNGVPTVPNGSGQPNPAGVTPAGEPAVGPADLENTRLFRNGTNESVLTLSVPKSARVSINGQATKTEGTSRRYMARDMKPGKVYRYNVEVAFDHEGQEVVKKETVILQPGKQHQLAFDFKPVTTTLTVDVPKDAKVILCGNKTKSEGTNRSFSTRDMIEGQQWKDYTIVVEYEKDGQLLTQRKTIDLKAGEQRNMTFDFAQETSVAKR